MNKIKSFYSKVNLNLIKEFLFIGISNLLVIVLGISLFVILKSTNYIVLTVIIFIFLNIILLYRYILINKKIDLNNLSEISNSFMYFYLDINNKVKPIEALTNMKSHCSISMSDNVVLLLDEIKKDKTFSPFIKFSNKYPSVIVEKLMLSIYELISNYNETNINVFNNSYKEYKDKVEEIYFKSYKNQFSFITLTPVIGVMIITIIVIISTILLARGYLNG